MISSLFAAVVEWFRGRRRAFTALSRKRRLERFASPPAVEVLEARCLLSATTTVPPLAEIPPLIALVDLVFATQAKGDPTVAFVGDSISWQYAYGTGAPVWAALMAPFGMADYGVSGQTTQDLLFQFSLGQLVGIKPEVVVLDIGGDNLMEGDSPQATAAGVLADVATIHLYQPQAHVLVLGILPGMESPSNPYRSEGAQTNQLVSQMLAGDPYASFVDLGSIFLQPDGTISTSMMFDYIHPTEQGYLDLTFALLPRIAQAFLPALTTPALPSFTSLSPPSSPLPSITSLSPPSSPLPITPS